MHCVRRWVSYLLDVLFPYYESQLVSELPYTFYWVFFVAWFAVMCKFLLFFSNGYRSLHQAKRASLGTPLLQDHDKYQLEI